MNLALQPLPSKARLFIGLVTALGIGVLSFSCANWESPDLLKYAGFLMVAIFSSGLRIGVPGITGTLSLTFLFVLFGIVQLTPSETVVLGALVTLVQCYWNQPRRPRAAQVIFNVASMTLAIFATERVYNATWMIAAPRRHRDPAWPRPPARCSC